MIIRATCEGISPILINAATDELLDQLRGRIRVVKDRDATLEEEAAKKLYVNTTGQPGDGIPALNLFSSMIIAGRKVKNGRTQVSTASTSTLPGFLAIQESFLLFDEDETWVADKRRGTNPNGGEMVCIVRPRFDKWGFDVTFELEDSEASPTIVKEILRVSGNFIGLGDFRPAKRGPFGRFRIVEWAETKTDG
jgi:hypothetical protein